VRVPPGELKSRQERPAAKLGTARTDIRGTFQRESEEWITLPCVFFAHPRHTEAEIRTILKELRTG
jgi:hypothetical protein